jgi:D-serine deaminase-like pyridoxal phosphate-dependent protein
MNPELYPITDVDSITSPSLIVFRNLVEHNLRVLVQMAGQPHRLRPHCKTHKTREIIEMQLKAGITRHKCATIAEAEMLASAGVEDVLLAYQMVGPNLQRIVKLMDKFPASKFTCLVDSPKSVSEISSAVGKNRSNGRLELMVDLDPGMNRTGIEPGADAVELCEMIASHEAFMLGGLHWYDGHHRQSDFFERKRAVLHDWQRLVDFRDRVMLQGIPIKRIVAGGTASFPILAEIEEPGLELSPGTTTYYDAQMAELYPEMEFRPALGILTRVISNNRSGYLTLDLGHKAIAADQPAGKRAAFPAIPDAVEIQHSEEHLVIQTASASEYELGDHLIAIPYHVCPTSALYDHATIISGNQTLGTWPIAARDRILTV